jgi:hypothetical protein
MTSAVDLLANPNLDIDPITAHVSAARGKGDDELAHFHVGSEDIEKLVLKMQKYTTGGRAAYANVRQVVREAWIEDSIDKTPTFTITVYDPEWSLLNSGALDGAVDINPGGIPHRWYRLDAFDVNDDEISMTFATRNAIFLSMHKRPIKYSRGKVTRAEAMLALVRKVKAVKIDFYCPQLHKKQAQAKYTGTTEKKKADARAKGFTASDKITVKGSTASPLQRKHISDVIECGIDIGAPGLVIVSAVMCIIQESGAGAKTTGNPPYIGDFQQNRGDGWPATGDPYKDAKGNGKRGTKAGGYYGMAIPAFQANPDQVLGMLVSNVQGVTGSTNPLNSGYAQETDRWRGEAQHAVNAFGGVDVNDPGSVESTDTSYRKKYEFMVGQPDGPKNENYLAAIYRWAQEVNWRAYWVRDVLHFMSEEDLFKAKARIRLRRFENGVEGVQMNWDRSKRVTQMTLKVRMDRWVCPVGTVVIWDEGSSRTGKGRWLVTNIRRSVFDQLGEIVLRKPMAEKKEPAPGSGTHKSTDDPLGSEMEAGHVLSVGDFAYPLALHGDFIQGPGAGNPVYKGTSNGTHRWGGQFSNWQSCNAVDIGVPIGTDIFAVGDATVTRLTGSYDGTGRSNPNGFNVTIQMSNGQSWFYTHLSSRVNLRVGQHVSKGQKLGKSGAANSVAHLHIGASSGNPQEMLGLN